MNIFVLMKQTFDTEEKIIIEGGSVSEDSVKFIINPYDEYAIEEALQLRDRHEGTVTLVSVGPERAAEALRTGLAMGADQAVHICDERIPCDELAVSKVIAAYLKQQSPDLILGGNFSVDTGSAQVAVRVAELLKLPHVSSITKLEIEANQAAVVRDAEGDLEKLTVTLPAVFTAQQGLNEPRYPSLPGIMKAKKKPYKLISLDDIDGTLDPLSAGTVRQELTLPPARSAGRILEGDLSEQVKELVSLLRHEIKGG